MRHLVAHTVLHCDEGTSDKVWAGIVTGGIHRPTLTALWGRRGAYLQRLETDYQDVPHALREFEGMVDEKRKKGYREVDWQDYEWRTRDLCWQMDVLQPLKTRPGWPSTRDKAPGGKRPPGRPELAYEAGVYRLPWEPAWEYVVPEDVDFGYPGSPNAWLVERGTAGGAVLDYLIAPAYVWRAGPKRPDPFVPVDLSAERRLLACERIAPMLVVYAMAPDVE